MRRRTKEFAMTGGPHPYHVIRVAEQRRAEFLAQADRDRLARLARPQPVPRPQWSDAFAVLTIVMAVALLAAGALVA
jgi:predicted phage tail protein